MPTKFTCLFPGRFQPFHNGHMLVVKGMAKLCGKLVVAIGSSDKSGTNENPFTAEERRDMIQRALQGEDIIPNFDVEFVMVPDMASDEAWAKAVLEKAGEVHQVWTGNPATKAPFVALGKEVKDIKEVPGISATDVRAMMKAGGDWKAKVPEEVAATISALNGVERVKGK
ncbi:nicotinamide-nucleotide adenylyltransferase [Patescibacteria group bacterium]|nr:MAG: nicotinamide-nucleotide adenylyltransferase [Patescibacteria group bacterium]